MCFVVHGTHILRYSKTSMKIKDKRKTFLAHLKDELLV